MKIKKIIAGVAAAAMACTTMAAMSVSAISTGVVDFEDGDCSFVYMNDLDGGSKATISVADYNGSKWLKVDPEKCDLYTKIWLDLDKMMDRSVATEIAKIEYDIAIVPDTEDGIVGSWIGGEIGSAGGFDKTGANIQASQADPGWSDKPMGDIKMVYDDFGNPAPGAAVGKCGRNWLMKNEKFTLTGANPFVAIMVNGQQTDGRVGDYSIYIDNIKFMDSKGNTLTMGVTPAAEETTAAPEETTAAPAEETTAAPAETEPALVENDDEEIVANDTEVAPAETEAPAEAEPAPAVTEAPAADATTTPAATGNVAVASIAAVMAVAGAAAIVAKKRK